MQLMALWWPIKNDGILAENIDRSDEEETELEYLDQYGAKKSVSIREMETLVDKYLNILDFRVKGSLKSQSEDIVNVKQIKHAEKSIYDMSGGQAKKLRLAIYLAMAEKIKPRLFLIDEPLNDLDATTRQKWQTVLNEHFTKGEIGDATTLFISTHNDNTEKKCKIYDKILFLSPHENENGAHNQPCQNPQDYIEWNMQNTEGTQNEEADTLLGTQFKRT